MFIHPGEILKEEFLVPLGISANRLALSLGVPPNRISAIINGERAITAETAILFGRAFDTSPEFWLNLQTHYDLETAKASSCREARQGASSNLKDVAETESKRLRQGEEVERICSALAV